MGKTIAVIKELSAAGAIGAVGALGGLAVAVLRHGDKIDGAAIGMGTVAAIGLGVSLLYEEYLKGTHRK